MTQLFISAVLTVFCSASYALHTQTTHEVRDSETWVTMTVEVGEQARADMLFVVDDSGSMSTHQTNLAAQAQLIADKLSFYTDINAAVITSSATNQFSQTGGGKFVGPVLNSGSASFAAALSQQIQVGTNGDAYETFFDPIYAATTEPLLSTTNAGFLRPDADLLLVILTDTEDQSPKMTAQTTFDHLKALKPNNRINVIAATIVDPNTCMGEQEWTEKTGIKDFVALSGGQQINLCGDFSTEIPKAIGVIKNDVSEVVLQAFPSTKVDFSTVTVKGDGKALVLGDLVNGWVFDTAASKVILGTAVVANKQIREIQISYKLLPL